MAILKGLTRRTALIGAGAGVLASSCSRSAPPLPPATGPFRHGVASGDPLADRAVIWTRVTSETDAPVEVRWDVGRDPNFTEIARSGVVQAGPETDFTVKIDVDGLEPGRDYIYRFQTGGELSAVGRLRTLPVGPLARMVIGLVSCANYPAGFFNAYRALASRADVDLVLHLGDYFYEYGLGGYATQDAERLSRVPDPVHEIVTLDDYRRRHAQYKSDPDLQAAHAAAPWMAVWDDHETANDSWAGGADNHQPESEGEWSERKRAALQAYYEWMPVREPENGRPREQAWRSVELGDLATLLILESRLTARSRPLTFDEMPVGIDDDPEDGETRERVRRFLADVVGDPARQMLGQAQESDLAASLAASTAAGKPWQILGNQVPVAPILAPDYTRVLPRYVLWYARMQGGEVWDYVRRTAFGLPLTLDSWDGYPAARERLYDAARDARANLVVATGDTHTFYAATLVDGGGRRRGVEFGTTSISSPSEYDGAPPGVDYGALTVDANPASLAYHQPVVRGFTLLELTPETATATMVGVNTTKSREHRVEAEARFQTRFAPGGGTTGLERLVPE